MKTTQETLTRRDRNKLRNRREILDAALKVFAANGYHHASMQAIADRADFAVSTLYALFHNKEDLYRTVSADVGRQCGEIFDTAMESGHDPYEKLINFARAKAEIWRESPDGIRMLENELHAQMIGNGAPPPNGIAHIYDRFMLRIETLFQEGIALGLFADKSPKALAMALDSSTSLLMKHAVQHPDNPPTSEDLEEIISIFFEPVLRSPLSANESG
jgi:AcrR family transcriptional regulator